MYEVRREGNVCQFVCLFTEGGEVPWSLVPGPFAASGPRFFLGGEEGVPQSLVPGPFPGSRGVPSQVLGQGNPLPSARMGEGGTPVTS